MNTQPDILSEIEVTDHLWISMPDGVRLAARLWLPKDCGPVPAILEYIPYRKTDMVRARDERNHPWFAANGYACIRVDMRGSGDSEGHMPDMYAEHELSDARYVINWLAQQSWCNGRVGMFGTSWGGTASLQASVNAPEALKAVIAVCATHDRYEDDIHHMGGNLLTDSIEWGATLPSILGSPPTTNVGTDWQNIWRDRIDKLAFPLEAWLREESRGSYWRHGSVKHDAAHLTVPILGVGGWSDRYSNSVMSLVDACPDLVWGVVGPWGHHYPDTGHPGPALGFQQLALDWWDTWLKAETPDATDWPRLRVWQREFETPADAIDTRAGHWVESGPATQHSESRTWYLAEQGLAAEPSVGSWQVPDDLRIGRASGDTGYFGRFGGLPLEQSADDARSLAFESEPLVEDQILYGAAFAGLTVRTSQPAGQLILRINDIGPDGTSSRVTYAVCNLALDDNLDTPKHPHLPGETEVGIPFHTTAYRVRSGHRLRLSISSSYWPLIWPSPEAGNIQISSGRIELPLLQGSLDAPAGQLPIALDLPAEKTHTVNSSPRLSRWQREENGKLDSGWYQPTTAVHYLETGTTFSYETRVSQSVTLSDPTSAEYHIVHRMIYDRPDGKADVQCSVTVRSDLETYQVEAQFTALWQDEEFGDKRWSFQVPR